MPTQKSSYLLIKKLVFYSMITVPFIPFILVLATGYFSFYKSLEIGTVSLMKRTAKDHRLMIESFLNERKANLEFILDTLPLDSIIHEQGLRQTLVVLQSKYHAFFDLGIFDETGTHLAYEGPYNLAGRTYSTEDWFVEVMDKGAYISDTFLGYRQVPHFIIAVKKSIKNKIYIIRATIDMSAFNDLVGNVQLGRTGEAYIINQNGIFQTGSGFVGSIMGKAPGNLVFPSSRDDIDIHRARINGTTYIYAITWMKDREWLLVIRQDVKDAFQALRSTVILAVIIAVIGGICILLMAGYLTNFIYRKMIALDTEKNRMQHQLERAGRLSELGQMAAGFAHEINNPLQIINSEQALVKNIVSCFRETGQLKESDDLMDMEDSIDQIKVQTGRCAQITQAILKFARQSEPEILKVDLNRLVNEILAMVEKKAQVSGIEIVRHIADDLPDICIDPGQFQQVMLNLVNNAVDAILDRHGVKGGRLDIHTFLNSTRDEIVISIKDNGTGIDNAVKSKIFIPFFTTKPTGKGTGLGLSVCYGIIKNMGGSLEFESQKNEGTSFNVRLPISECLPADG